MEEQTRQKKERIDAALVKFRKGIAELNARRDTLVARLLEGFQQKRVDDIRKEIQEL